MLVLEDLKDALADEVDCVVIGTGYAGAMEVADEVIEYFKSRGKEIYIANTRKAIEIYNELVKAERRVLGAFHLTC